MCTAIFIDGILARTVDRDGLLGEHFAVVRENYAGGVIRGDYGEIWSDGVNRNGLMTALLNYRKEMDREIHSFREDSEKIHPARLIPRLLGECGNTDDAEKLLRTMELSEDMPAMYPHYIICDAAGKCIVYESGRVCENPLGVLANAPSYGEQTERLCTLKESGHPLPWDHTSFSRFCRAAWLREHADKPVTMSDCFALLDALAVPKGMDPRKNYRTLLKTVMSASDGTYSFADEENRTVRSVRIGECGSWPVKSCDTR